MFFSIEDFDEIFWFWVFIVLIFSKKFSCRFKNGKFEIVKGLEMDEFSKGKLQETVDELVAERKEGFCGLGLM